MKLIDTDVAIDHFHGHRAALEYFAEALAAGETLAVSVVTVAELGGGMRPGEEERTERLYGLFTVLEINRDISLKAGAYLRQFRRSHNLELGDALIAATAGHFNAELVTRNLKHYPMSDVQVIVPYERGQA
ncbi:MAG: type II toxin-antitoxin system VapC family toxin [Chloroflexi bacterium]|nr:type II toxin-antitoxin system VapC family toxin [Chloroflexota bacterium]MBI5829157.1 type II toxin-antitoxin system VapC family toxin [Chloroflexota bacterium]